MHPAVQFDRLEWNDRPMTGGLDHEEADSLVAVLRRHTGTPGDCWLAVWTGYGCFTGGAATRSFKQVSDSGDVSQGCWQPASPRPGGFEQGRDSGSLSRAPAAIRTLEPPPGLAEAATFSLPQREYYLYRGACEVVPRFEYRPGFLQTPNLWWPDDRAWVVASEVDLDSTIVACDRACAAALLGSKLEALEVSPDLRLDIDGDTVNA